MFSKFNYFVSLVLVILVSQASDSYCRDKVENEKIIISTKDDIEDLLLQLLVPIKKQFAYQAATALGDKHIIKPLTLSKKNRNALDKYIDIQVFLIGATDGGVNSDAKNRLLGLWHLASSKLLIALTNKNINTSEHAIDILVIMRNADIIKSIIKQLKASDNKYVKSRCIYALGKMTERSICKIKSRLLMNEKKTKTIAVQQIIPALKKVKAKEKDPKLLKDITWALNRLNNPIERGAKTVIGEKALELEARFQRELEKRNK